MRGAEPPAPLTALKHARHTFVYNARLEQGVVRFSYWLAGRGLAVEVLLHQTQALDERSAQYVQHC